MKSLTIELAKPKVAVFFYASELDYTMYLDNLNWERRKVLSWKIHGKGSRSSLALKYSLCSLICIDMLSVEISIIAWDTVSHCEAWWQDVSNEIMKSTLIHKFLSFFIDFSFCEMDVG